MITKSKEKEDYNSEIEERSKEELLEEETKNQQTIDIFIESHKNWCWKKTKLNGVNYEF